jgi:hypothetical protein
MVKLDYFMAGFNILAAILNPEVIGIQILDWLAYMMKAEQKVSQLHFEHTELPSHQSFSFQSEVIWVYDSII